MTEEQIIDLTIEVPRIKLLKHNIDVSVITINDTDEEDLRTKSPANKRRGKRKMKNADINDLGICPICYEKLGKNHLASTSCGHVFCLCCIQEAIRRNPSCPTCRKYLKGKYAYHRLFLNK